MKYQKSILAARDSKMVASLGNVPSTFYSLPTLTIPPLLANWGPSQ